MDSQISAWGRSDKSQKQEIYWQRWFWLYTFLGAALILFSFNLGDLPLQESYEGKVAQVAKELWQTTAGNLAWEPKGKFHLQPFPLVELLISLAYRLGSFNPTLTRLPGMLLATISVPLFYSLGREIFPSHRQAILAGFIYLTFLPVLRYGRLATLDGAVLFLLIALLWCVVRSRRDLRYCLAAGISLGLLCLLKGLGGMVGAIVLLIFLAWDTPRLLSCNYFWGGILLGITPMLGWYGAQWHYYLQTLGWQASLGQFFTTLGQGNKSLGSKSWFYFLEVWKYGMPWLGFAPTALVYAWRQRNWSWSKLLLVWLVVYLSASRFFPSTTWSLLPLYPALALGIGAYFNDSLQLPQQASYPRFWAWIFTLLALVALGGVAYVGIFAIGGKLVFLGMTAVVLTMVTAAMLTTRRDWQFLVILFWGNYVALLLFFATPYWGLDFRGGYQIKPLEAQQIFPTNIPAPAVQPKPLKLVYLGQ